MLSSMPKPGPRFPEYVARWVFTMPPFTAGRICTEVCTPREVRLFKMLEEENRQLEKLVAELSLGRQRMLQDVLSKRL